MRVHVLRRLVALAVGLSALLLPGDFVKTPSGSALAATTYNWLQFDGSPEHSGDNVQETILSSTNVASLTQTFHVSLPAVADGAPVYLSSVSTPSGSHDLLYVTTKAGDIVALDAHTGQQIWVQHNPAGSCKVNNGSDACYTTSSPAIDPNLQYVYSYGLDGKVHKYAVGTGTEVTGGGWPEVVTLKGFDEKGSSALSTATAANGTTYLYATTSGYPGPPGGAGDMGDYQGHLTAINLSTGAQVVFNAVCSNQPVHFVETPGTPDCSEVQSGIWARPAVIYSPTTNRIYLVTGNATFSPSSFDWGDTVFALNPDGTSNDGVPLDTYTPSNYDWLNTSDHDLGSAAPAIFPPVGNNQAGPYAMQTGKDSVLRVINLANLSGQGGPGHVGGELSSVNLAQGNEVATQPATWSNPADGSAWVFVANYNGISGLELNLSGGSPTLQSKWTVTVAGSSPIVVNNVLFYATKTAVQALDPVTGIVLWQAPIGGVHWESPIVVNGVLYITDQAGFLTAFSPAGVSSPAPGPTSPAPTPAPNVRYLPRVTSGSP